MLNGLAVPGSVTQEVLDKLKSFQLYPDDVFVVTCPKCGTTWAQQIVKLIRKNGIQDGVHINKSLPWLERGRPIQEECIIQPRGFKSHFPYDRFPHCPPCDTPCKYIYIARNPKDVTVSYYYHNKAVFFPDIDRETFSLSTLLSRVLPLRLVLPSCAWLVASPWRQECLVFKV